MKTSWRQLLNFDQVATVYLQRNGHDTKLRYALGRVTAQIRAQQDRTMAQLTEIEIQNCEVDEKGIIVRDAAGNLQFTRAGMIERNRQQNAFLDAPEIEIEPHLVKDVPPGLTEQERLTFAGLVIE